jgi:Protein of unknown function (DUF1350)
MVSSGLSGHRRLQNRTSRETRVWSCHCKAREKPLAVVIFLGGAFVGAVPEVTYRSVALISIDLFCDSTGLS